MGFPEKLFLGITVEPSAKNKPLFSLSQLIQEKIQIYTHRRLLVFSGESVSCTFFKGFCLPPSKSFTMQLTVSQIQQSIIMGW